MGLVLPVRELCTPSTWALYSEYKSHVLLAVLLRATASESHSLCLWAFEPPSPSLLSPALGAHFLLPYGLNAIVPAFTSEGRDIVFVWNKF